MAKNEIMQNRQYKDSVFVDLFSQDKTAHVNFISLYNALHNTHLPLNTELQPLKLEQVLYMKFYNDVSFVIDNKIIVLAEHQSTINKNMPLRFLEYISRLYEHLYESKEKYRKKQIKVPTPEFFVFYNGVEDFPEETIIKLSDAFILKTATPNLEIIVRVLNINTEKHNARLAKCETIKEYSQFVGIIRKFDLKSTAGETADKVVSYTKAIEYCISNNILKDYLKRKSKEVLNMLLAEYDYATDIAVQREEAWEDGAYQKALDTAKNLMHSNKLTLQEISSCTGLSLEEVEQCNIILS